MESWWNMSGKRYTGAKPFIRADVLATAVERKRAALRASEIDRAALLLRVGLERRLENYYELDAGTTFDQIERWCNMALVDGPKLQNVIQHPDQYADEFKNLKAAIPIQSGREQVHFRDETNNAYREACHSGYRKLLEKLSAVATDLVPDHRHISPASINEAAGTLKPEKIDAAAPMILNIRALVKHLKATGPPAKQQKAEIRNLEETIPKLNKDNGQWLSNKFAARLHSLKTETLKSYRYTGISNGENTLGRDKDGRIWRRTGTQNSHPWYLRSSLTSTSKVEEKP